MTDLSILFVIIPSKLVGHLETQHTGLVNKLLKHFKRKQKTKSYWHNSLVVLQTVGEI